jgi:hypothetical protein
MRNVVRHILLVAALAAASVLPAAAGPQKAGARVADAILFAQDDDGRWRGRGRGPGGGDNERVRLLPLESVLANVARQYPGHHLGVDGPFQRDGRWIYRIKWLTPEGRVLIVFADAVTGQVLGARG